MNTNLKQLQEEVVIRIKQLKVGEIIQKKFQSNGRSYMFIYYGLCPCCLQSGALVRGNECYIQYEPRYQPSEVLVIRVQIVGRIVSSQVVPEA